MQNLFVKFIPLKLLFGILIIFSLFLTAWYYKNGDINFSSDISRDFLLLQEIDQKKIVLIGPRSSTGLFHGPLWLYLNYPAYLIGQGNPAVVGWYWLGLIIAFLISGFVIAKNLFGTTSAYLYILMTSLYMVFQSRGLFNPHGAMFLIPTFFYFFIRYWQTNKIRYLLIHLILGGTLIQFQMAIGIPFTILSFLAILFKIFFSKSHLPRESANSAEKWGHLLAFLIIPLSLINFLIFDLRHEFLLTKTTTEFLSVKSNGQLFNYASFVPERLTLMLGGVEILRADPGKRNLILTLISLLFLLFQIKDKRYRLIYLSFLYFYVGYFILSLINKGPMIYFYLFPIFPFVFLIFCSFITSQFKKIFLIIFSLIYLLNIQTAITDTKSANGMIGIDRYSWKFLENMGQQIYNNSETEFGYFVFAPDAFGYEPKYAMSYLNKINNSKAIANQKKPITYLIAQPHKYWNSDWYKTVVLHIDKKPVSIINYPNGYKVEKYILTDEEIKIPTEGNVDPGIHFR